MLAFENTVTIARSKAEVFNFVTDQRNNPKWNYFILKVEKTNSIEGAGAEFLQVRKRDQQRMRIAELVRDQYCVVESLPGERPSVRRCLTFAGDEAETTIHDRVELRLPLPAFLSSMLTARPQKAVLHNLNCLKALMETGEVVLMDGRRVGISR